MLRVICSRLTYANTMATVAVFLGLVGGAYALSGVPDGTGVYHGCVDAKTGALRVVARASFCRTAKTVKNGKRRVRIPGESAIAWNQQGQPGQPGQAGQPGLPGQPGSPGRPGPGAVKLHFDRAPDNEIVTLGSVGPWTINAQCIIGGASVPSPFKLFVDGPGSADLALTEKFNGGTPEANLLHQDLSADDTVFSIGIKGGDVDDTVGTMVLSADPSAPVAHVAFLLVDDATQPGGHCSFIGTATPAV
jgi:hypothetical protein